MTENPGMFRRIETAIVALASTGRHRRALLAATVLACSGLSAACSDQLFGGKPGGVAHVGLVPHFGAREAAIYRQLETDMEHLSDVLARTYLG